MVAPTRRRSRDPQLVVAASVDLSEPSACSVHVLSLASELGRTHEVTLLARRPRGPLALAAPGVMRTVWLPVPDRLPNAVGFLMMLPALLRLWLGGARLLYLRAGTLSVVVTALARLLPRMRVVQEHNGWVQDDLIALGRPPIVAGAIGRLQILDGRLADAMRVVQPGLSGRFGSRGVDRSKIAVIGSGTDLNRLHAIDRGAALAAHALPADRIYLGFLGNLVPWQGVDLAVDALAHLADDLPTLDLLVIGDGPLRGTLERRVAAAGLTDRVRWLGWVPAADVNVAVSCIDIAVAPFTRARNGGIGLSPLKIRDYAAAGRAIVTARLLGMTELEEQGVLACHEPDDAADLAAVVRRLALDHEARRLLGERARDHAEAHFTWQRTARQVIGLLEPGGRPGPR